MKKTTIFCLLLILLLSVSSVANTSIYFAHDEDLKPPNLEEPIVYPKDDFII